jgi:hypothetical protein
MKHYSPTGRRYHCRPLKRLLDTWDRNGSTWQIYDDDDDDDGCLPSMVCPGLKLMVVQRVIPYLMMTQFKGWNMLSPNNTWTLSWHAMPKIAA